MIDFFFKSSVPAPAIAKAMVAPLMDNGETEENGDNQDWTDDKERCYRCRKLVFFAERVSAINQVCSLTIL